MMLPNDLWGSPLLTIPDRPSQIILSEPMVVVMVHLLSAVGFDYVADVRFEVN